MSAVPDRTSAEIQLVVFDLGRVLVRICRDWQHACECAGLTWPEIDAPTAARLKQVAQRAEIGRIGAPQFYADAARLLACAPQDIRAISDAFVIGPYPGAAELLAELASAGIKTACLSNTNEHHWSLLSEPGHRTWLPMDRLNHHFASHLMRARKPDEAIYAQVEREVGLAPGQILFFDDIPENIEAAHRRGWNAQWIDPAVDDPIFQIRSTLRRYRIIL